MVLCLGLLWVFGIFFGWPNDTVISVLSPEKFRELSPELAPAVYETCSWCLWKNPVGLLGSLHDRRFMYRLIRCCSKFQISLYDWNCSLFFTSFPINIGGLLPWTTQRYGGCLSIEVRVMDHESPTCAFGPIGVQALDELQRGATRWL